MKKPNTKTQIEKFNENFLRARITDLNKLKNADVANRPVRVGVELTLNRGKKNSVYGCLDFI
ncbi:MAG: hypothetical protein CM15mV120_170 [uncultured marine virus]|nr:MAG: hypothetical protein CM15mV120_170 [uncultured marine virus]